MQHAPTKSDSQFLAAFEACDINGAEFGHREHVRLAYIYLALHPLDVALEEMRTGLHALLAHLGAPAAKYHETVTRGWLLGVQHFMSIAGSTSGFDDFLAKGGARLLDPAIMSTHYSTAVIQSDEARAHFVEPDLQPFPQNTV